MFPFLALLSLSSIICLFSKQKIYNLLYRGRNLGKDLFHWQGWVTAPPLPPTQLNPAPGQPKSQEEMKCTCQRPPLPLQFLSKTALLLQPWTIPGLEDVPWRGMLAISFLRQTVQQSHASPTWRKFRKGNVLKVHSTEFSRQGSELCDTQAGA